MGGCRKYDIFSGVRKDASVYIGLSGTLWKLSSLAALQVIPSVLYGPGISCVLMLCDSMLADVCYVDELEHDARREAMFGAIYGWFTKVGLTVAPALSGLLLVCTGFEVRFGADQPDGTVFLMRILAVVVPASGMVVATLLMCGYKLNAARMAEVKAAPGEKTQFPVNSRIGISLLIAATRALRPCSLQGSEISRCPVSERFICRCFERMGIYG